MSTETYSKLHKIILLASLLCFTWAHLEAQQYTLKYYCDTNSVNVNSVKTIYLLGEYICIERGDDFELKTIAK